MRSIHHRVMTTSTSNIVVTFGIGNWDILGWFLGFVLVSCSLGLRPSGRLSRFHHGRWGWRSSPSASNQVSTSQFLQLVKRLDLAICGKFCPTFVQALKCPSSGILKVFITWRRWNYFPFFLLLTWKCSAFVPLVQYKNKIAFSQPTLKGPFINLTSCFHMLNFVFIRGVVSFILITAAKKHSKPLNLS